MYLCIRLSSACMCVCICACVCLYVCVYVRCAAGCSTLPAPTFGPWIRDVLAMRHIWASPNGVWVMIALAMYFACPYDLSPSSAAASGPFSWAFFQARFPLWATLVFGYTSFWHVTLYFLGWADRPFIQNRPYNLNKGIICAVLFCFYSLQYSAHTPYRRCNS